MAGSERMVGEAMKQIAEKLREGADKAQEAYPEAAQDARDIADQIEQANLASLASNTAGTMLKGQGSKSHERAEHLRQEMEKLMSECSQCKGGGEGEFAARLKLMRQMLAGDTFSQMAQCKKFGLNMGQGQSMGGGGMGMAGMMGTGNSQPGPQMSLLGGESMLGQQNANRESVNSGNARNNVPTKSAVADGGNDKEETGKIAIVDRPSKSATGDIMTDEYGEIVDAYFEKLTTANGNE